MGPKKQFSRGMVKGPVGEAAVYGTELKSGSLAAPGPPSLPLDPIIEDGSQYRKTALRLHFQFGLA